jgi:hypothetical protein
MHCKHRRFTATERRRYNKDIGDFQPPPLELGSSMKKSLLALAVLIVSLIQVLAKESADSAAIIAATKTYVAANSGMTKITVTVEQVDGDFAA